MKKLLFLSIMIFMGEGMAYPILYSCKDGSIDSQARLNQNDLFEQFMALEKSKQKEFAESVCAGSKTCLKDFDLIVKAAGSSIEVARKLFEEELSKIKADFHKVDLPTDSLNDFVRLRNDYSEILACQNAKAKLGPDDFLTDNGSRVLTTYPFWNDYSFTSVCPQAIDSEKHKSESYCGPIFKSELDRVIEESILMGVDPYLVLSLSMMEGGSGNVGRLYLDPIGVMGAMGCSSKQVANNTDSSKALNSYGTSYVVNADVKKDSKLQKKLKSYFKHFKPAQVSEGESYYCYNVLGQGGPDLYETPQQDSCCIDMGFKADLGSSQDVSHALTYHFIDKITRNKFRGKEDPAWRAQRYNGYTNLMGAAEGVSNWRAGVNYYEDPAYGYQTMDYMLNSLMFNPYINSKVSEFGKGKQWDSLLCEDKSDGVYAVDSDRYFKKHKESKRLGVIEEKYKAGRGYASLSSRERKVMDQELAATSHLNSKMPTSLPFSKIREIESTLWPLAVQFMKEEGGDGQKFEIFKTSMVEKEAWKNSVQGKHHFSEKELDIIYSFQVNMDRLEKKEAKVTKKGDEIREELRIFCEIKANEEDCEKYRWPISDYSFGNSGGGKKLAVPVKFSSIMEKVESLIEEQKSIKEEKVKTYKTYDVFGNDDSKWKNLRAVELYTRELEPLEEAVKRYSSNESFTPELEKDLRLYYLHLKNYGKGHDTEEAFEEYFKSVYKKRKDIGGASEYPWRRFTEEEVKKTVDYFSARKNGSAQMGWPGEGMGGAIMGGPMMGGGMLGGGLGAESPGGGPGYPGPPPNNNEEVKN